ncbi:hypothetical protein ILYODFUR_036209 [Ilyodon furcidens]|uniref:Uncharacterized protein n=1 Tax=Ilyodon furcidens TaxID=33524 RepID=A0ABV0T4S8_9TELE
MKTLNYTVFVFLIRNKFNAQIASISRHVNGAECRNCSHISEADENCGLFSLEKNLVLNWVLPQIISIPAAGLALHITTFAASMICLSIQTLAIVLSSVDSHVFV